MNEDKQRQCYKQLKCFWPKCRYRAKYESDMNKHISYHLNKRKFVCEECIKQFHQNSYFLKHKRCVHSNDRPFVCNQINCNKKFKSKSEVIQHNLTHSSVKSFGCNKCDKRFKTNYELNNHKNLVHSSIRPFVCSQSDCNKSFKLKRCLYVHKMRFHSDIKRHKCFHKNCEKSFVTIHELKQHIGFKHSTERPFICKLHNCNSSFKSRANLDNHKKTFHFKNKL